MKGKRGRIPAVSDAKLKKWLWLWAALILALLPPVVASWLETLSRRSWEENVFQVLTAGLLALALPKTLKEKLPSWNPSPWGLFALMGVMLAHLLGGLLMIRSLYWGSYLLIPVTLAWAAFGNVALRKWGAMPLFALFLLPEMPTDLKMGLSLPLQLASTQLSTALASLWIPITATGNMFYLRGEPYEVTVACGGLHTWIGFLFAGMLRQVFEGFSTRGLGFLLLAAPALTLGLNTIRLFVTALVAYWVSPDAGLAIHTNLDYVLFPLGLALLWQGGRRFHD